MPELPEVETVARDLRRHLLPGRRAAGPGDHRRARRLDADAARRGPGPVRRGRHRPADRGGRPARQAARHRPRRRRVPDGPPQDDRPAVRRAGVAARATRTSAWRWRSTTAASCGSATSASSAGSGCTAPTTTRSTASGRSRWTRGSPCASSAARIRGRRARLKPLLVDQAFIAGDRQHLRRRGAVALAAPPAALGAVAAPGGRARACTGTSSRSSPRPSSGAGRRSTTTRRPTATARCRSASTCTSARASRAGAAAARSGGS